MVALGAAVIVRLALAALIAIQRLPSPVASPTAAPSAATSPTALPRDTVFRALALSRTTDRLLLAGGEVLRIAPDCTCITEVSGRAVALVLGDDDTVHALRLAGSGQPLPHPASDIPRAAYVFPTISSVNGDPSVQVTVTIVVAVPAQTPSTDDVYVSTEKSGYRPNELRMSRLDPVHWTVSLTQPRGARIAYRFTRGSFTTTERNDARQLPPARVITAVDGLKTSDTVATWADIN